MPHSVRRERLEEMERATSKARAPIDAEEASLVEGKQQVTFSPAATILRAPSMLLQRCASVQHSFKANGKE